MQAVWGNTGYASEFVHDTVNGVVVDGIDLNVPSALKGSKLAQIGILDVTASPFFADKTGKTDSTKSIQKAINYARDKQLVCYFPPGDYLVSDTLDCTRNFYRRSTNKVLGARQFPCLLVGSSGTQRSRIYLKDFSDGFNSARQKKYLFHFWARNEKLPNKPQPNISWNQGLINIDIYIGKGNDGAVAIRHRGAQGSTIQDCNIYNAYGHTGIEGGIGSGGYIANIKIIGGKVGLDFNKTQPVPTIVGATLKGQSRRSIIYRGRQSLVLVGCEIEYTGNQVAIEAKEYGTPFTGQMAIVDSKIAASNGIGIATDTNIYINNSYIQADKVISHKNGYLLEGDSTKWLHVIEYALGVPPSNNKLGAFTSPVIFNDIKKTMLINAEFSESPHLVSKKHDWGNAACYWDSDTAVNIKEPPYNAMGNGISDDTKALQLAIDNEVCIFLPKGYYKISKTLKLRPNTKIVGVAPHLSIVMASKEMDSPDGLMLTPSDGSSDVGLSFLSLYSPLGSNQSTLLKWQGNGVVRSVNFSTMPPLGGYSKHKKRNIFNKPLVSITGNGQGLWYGFFQEGIGEGEGYRHISINDTSGPLSFYQFNLEYARSLFNAEILNSSNVSIYGLKAEGNHRALSVKDSNNVKIIGYGGNASAFPDSALFYISKSNDIKLVNLVDQVRKTGAGHIKSYPGVAIDPDLWTMVEIDKGRTLKPRERPVLLYIK